MAITVDAEKAPLLSKLWTREASLVAIGSTLIGLATLFLFASASYFDATRQGMDVHFGRGLWMYAVGFMPWFLMAPAVVMISKHRLFGQASLIERVRDGTMMAVTVFTIQFLNMVFVLAPLIGIPSNEMAGQVGLQAWIPDLMMFIIAVLCGRMFVRPIPHEIAPIDDTPAPVEIVVKSLSRMDIVSSDDVMAISAQGNYVALVTQDRELLHRATLSTMRNQLDALGFIQIHRSHLVKTKEIASVHRKDGRVRALLLRNGAKLPVSPRGARLLPTIFGNTDA